MLRGIMPVRAPSLPSAYRRSLPFQLSWLNFAFKLSVQLVASQKGHGGAAVGAGEP